MEITIPFIAAIFSLFVSGQAHIKAKEYNKLHFEFFSGINFALFIINITIGFIKIYNK